MIPSRLIHDPQRPQFHFLPPANWMNDPNGLIQWQGQYHLFYQYNPNGPFHGTIHWGHAASKDLLHWDDLPLALAPTPGGPDAGGCWTGCALDNGGIPALIYTGVHPQVVCLATGSEDLIHWQKHPDNPVIAIPPAELGPNSAGQFRDPFVWKEPEGWRMVIGSKIEGQGGVILHYRSADLLGWEYLGVLLQGDINQTIPFWTGAMWECPNLVQLGDRYLLFFSVQSELGELLYTVCYVGDYDDSKFTPLSQSRLIYGNSFYAPQAMYTEDGRVVVFGWLKEGRGESAILEAGWAGVMSLPLVLTLNPQGRLCIEPADEVYALRRQHWHFDNLEITVRKVKYLDNVCGDCLEIQAVFEPGMAAEFGLKLRCSPDGEEKTLLIYNRDQGCLILEPNESTSSMAIDRDIQKAPLYLDANGELKLHIFIDHSVIEVFANDEVCLAGRIYPTRPDSLGLDLFARNGKVKLKSLEVWEIESIW